MTAHVTRCDRRRREVMDSRPPRFRANFASAGGLTRRVRPMLIEAISLDLITAAAFDRLIPSCSATSAMVNNVVGTALGTVLG